MPRRRTPDPLALTVGLRVKQLREEAGLTVEKLAYVTDVRSKGHLSSLEHGLVMPTVATLAALGRLASRPSDLPGARHVEGRLQGSVVEKRSKLLALVLGDGDADEDGAALADGELEQLLDLLRRVEHGHVQDHGAFRGDGQRVTHEAPAHGAPRRCR
jgi:transcriptional regulator with XRE-family HTH domain